MDSCECDHVYEGAIVQAGLKFCMYVDKGGDILGLNGFKYPLTGCEPGRPLTMLIPGMFSENDNIYNNLPNFSPTGLAFSDIDMYGVTTFSDVRSGDTVDDTTYYNSLLTSATLTGDVTRTQVTIYIRRKYEDEEKDKCKKLIFGYNLNILKYCKAYEICCPKLLLFGYFTTDKNRTINQINMTFGSSKATLLAPNNFDANDNLYVTESFTAGGVSITTTDTVGIVTFLNFYVDIDTKETLLDISVDGPDNIVTVQLCCLKIKQLKD